MTKQRKRKYTKRNKKNYNRILIGGLAALSTIFLAFILWQSPLWQKIHIVNSSYIFGIDVSHYQGKINWSKVKESHHPIKFVFVRATMGSNGKDKRFKTNWNKAKRAGYIRGAYHYYRPHENSNKQFANFKASVKLQSGDFRPVLDIEEASKYGADNLRRGIQNWLKLAEQTYGVKPIIYTGRTYYHTYLKGHIEGYPLWIASYSGKHRLRGIDWTFHQFSDRVRIKGINEWVDGNDFRGSMEQLEQLCIP